MATSEKDAERHNVNITETSSNHDDTPSNVDGAWKFLTGHRDADLKNQVDLKALRWRIDRRIVPLLLFAYTIQFLDKIVFNYAGVMTMRQDLKLQGNDFSNLATFLFVGQALYEIPNIYFVQTFPPAKYLAANLIFGGIATACGAAARDYQTLLVSRVFLGFFEASIPTSIILICSQWYTKPEQGLRFSIWYTGIGIGQIVGGGISYGFQNMGTGAVLAPWRTMFLTTGCLTIVVGISVLILLPDVPMTASWMSVGEKVAFLKHISVNQTGIHGGKFRWREVVEAFMDLQVWLLLLAVLLNAMSGGIITAYSATLIRNLGYGPKRAALINMPSGAVGIVFTLLAGVGIRTRSHRWAWVLVCLIPTMIGGALMSFLPIDDVAGILAGIYLVSAAFAAIPIFVNWTVANVAGSTKRAFAVSASCTMFAVGNIISPQTFQARDAPQYRPAKITVLATQAGAALVTIVLALYYVWQNKTRKVKDSDIKESFMSPDVWARMTDRENKKFRYSY
ncbi:major facilitator superfamily domain-containing protein [Podospora didyma]|uniref:Major facilitator superfamily domain-containing protein n=1 Tax=Podospora didyma TaxID=330526 RepID=A0AAE0P141_9PEZI|nr:major facilitator superfamily domain-containing protein [Podospora didyma]